ncbi:MAG: hypothetical protein GC162_05350 [Planctomycetes bacterium]|nr:hypothetical protein [Planctomycetota bacterium]
MIGRPSKFRSAALCAAAAVLMLGTSARATFLTPNVWATGWSRGDADTLYAEWDAFQSLTGNAPDVGVFHPPAGNPTLSATNAVTAFVTGGGSGGNIYSFFDDALNIEALVPNDASAGKLTTVVVQIATLGTPFLLDSLRVNGEAPVFYGELSKVFGNIPGFGDTTDIEAWALFHIDGTPDLTLSLTAGGQHMSLDRVAIDAIVTDASAGFFSVVPQGTSVPEPTSAMVMGAMTLLTLRRPRR